MKIRRRNTQRHHTHTSCSRRRSGLSWVVLDSCLPRSSWGAWAATVERIDGRTSRLGQACFSTSASVFAAWLGPWVVLYEKSRFSIFLPNKLSNSPAIHLPFDHTTYPLPPATPPCEPRFVLILLMPRTQLMKYRGSGRGSWLVTRQFLHLSWC